MAHTVERRFQIFISSTYLDLREQRQWILHEVLTRNFFPAGMELFPSASVNPLEYIKGAIDDSDFYLLMVGNRHGDCPEGESLSYTELEYNYAMEKRKACRVLLYEGATDHNDTSDRRKSRALAKFKTKLKTTHNPAYCQDKADLVSQVGRALDDLRREHEDKPVGWVRCAGGGRADDLVSPGDWSRLGSRITLLFLPHHFDRAIGPQIQVPVPWRELLYELGKEMYNGVAREYTVKGILFRVAVQHDPQEELSLYRESVLKGPTTDVLHCLQQDGIVAPSRWQSDGWVLTDYGERLYSILHNEHISSLTTEE